MSKLKKLIDKMDNYDSKGQHIYLVMILRNPIIIDFLKDFMSKKDKDIDKETLKYVKSIIIHCKTLYELDIHILPYDDIIYDKILAKYKKFDKEPFGLAGVGLANVKYKYDTLAGTLNKAHFVYDAERKETNDDRLSIEQFMSQFDKHDKINILINDKEDGTSVVMDMQYDEYNNRFIGIKGVSRGRKDYGEGNDVSRLCKLADFDASPMLSKFNKCFDMGVQYEMLISNDDKSAFEKYMNRSYANNRSAVVALLRRLIFSNDDKEINKLLKFVSLMPVGFEFKDDAKKYMDKYNWDSVYDAVLKTFKVGNIDMRYTTYVGTTKELLIKIRNYADYLIDTRCKLNHDIDGAVITILDKDIQNKLGRKGCINQYQIAFKFPEEAKKTVIRNMITTVGSYGYLEFLMETDPVYLNGTLQNKGQIHSIDRFNKFGFREGDEVYLKLSGDVIPVIYRDDTCRKGTGEKFKLPTKCECGTDLILTKNKLRCPNPNCKFRVIGGLNIFLNEVNAKGLGPATCEALYNKYNISNPIELLSLTKDDFMKLDGFDKESSKQAMQTIMEIRTRPRSPAVILSSLGIDSFRKSTAEKVLDMYDFDKLLKYISKNNKNNLINKLKDVKGIDKNADIIADGLINKYEILSKLIKMMTVSNPVKKNGITIRVTGFRDKDFNELAESRGYKVKESGSSFDILVMADESYMAKPKAQKALVEHKEVMTKEAFIDKYLS